MQSDGHSSLQFHQIRRGLAGDLQIRTERIVHREACAIGCGGQFLKPAAGNSERFGKTLGIGVGNLKPQLTAHVCR
jgi:hypothetical protein